MIDILDFIPEYPSIYESDDKNSFEEAIFLKKEFNDLKQGRRNELLGASYLQVTDFLNHQKIIARFLSSNTLYDRLLIFHDPGTGKTFSAIATIEQIKNEKSNFDGAIILEKGNKLLDNFKAEILKATNNIYVPANYENMSDKEKVSKVNKALKKFYSFYTFYEMAKTLSKLDDLDIVEKFSNKIIVIDEIHNIKEKVEKEKVVIYIYREIYRLIHVAKNTKILLMTGTPIKDHVKEFSNILNLLLPVNERINSKTFVEDYFDQNEDDEYSFKTNKKEQLEDMLKGKVSYIKNISSDVKKVFIGEKLGLLKHFIVYKDEMSKFQSEVYIREYDKDISGTTSVYIHSRQCSLFVFPDKSFGSVGFSRYIITKKKRGYKLSNELKDLLYSNTATNEHIIENIYKYSSKYAQLITNILRAKKERKLVFIYCEFVKGGGSILLGLLLQLFGYSMSTGKETSEDIRYALINNLSTSKNDIKRIIDLYNSEKNKYGDYLQCIIGSEVISEGFSLFNVQEEYILTPYWNYAETEQIIARGLRFGSHNDLIKIGLIPTLDIYQCVSIPDNCVNNLPTLCSIDLQMYEISETKDYNIKQVERLLKETAFDCALNYDRNVIRDENDNFTRECEYNICKYTCNGISDQLINKQSTLDLTTYNLFYNDIDIRELIKGISNLFESTFRLSLRDMIDRFLEYNTFEIITALRIIINDNIEIKNKYGFSNYLRSYKDEYFLVSDIGIKHDIEMTFYGEFPTIYNNVSYQTALNEYISVPKIINKIFSSINEEEIKKIIKILSCDIIEFIVENCIIAQLKGIEKNRTTRDIILTIYKDYYVEFDTFIISTFDNKYKCLYKNDIEAGWKICLNDNVNMFRAHKLQKLENANEYGYYGLYNDDKFCLKQVIDQKDVKKFSKIITGTVCGTGIYNKELLLKLVMKIFKIEIPTEQDVQDDEISKFLQVTKSITQKQLISEILKNPNITKIFTKDEIKSFNLKELQNIFFWSGISNVQICSYIKAWLNNKNLLFFDTNCGNYKKHKKNI